MRQYLVDLLLAALVVGVVAALVFSADSPPQVTRKAAAADPAPAANDLRFATLDVFVDPRGVPLAAYQIALTPKTAPGHESTFISFSAGGTHPAFRDKMPFHDPVALNRPDSRLILAALSTDADLPAARTRVARIDIAYTGDAPPRFDALAVVLSDAEARLIPNAAVAVEVTPVTPR